MGGNGIPHPDPDGPPRYWAHKRCGHGTFANDRPPVIGVVGRESGDLRPEVVASSDRETLEGATVNTDEWRGRAAWERARDDDGDGASEVHDNTLAGIWTGLQNFLRTFRCVSKHDPDQDGAMFHWG